MTNDTELFLRAFLREMPQGKLFYLWDLQSKLSTFFDCNQLDDIHDYLARHASDDIYISMGMADQPCAPKLRIKRDEVSGILGLWLDIDYGTAGHKKGQIPPDYEAALHILDCLPPATILVKSGGGLHAYFLFNQAYIFGADDPADTEADRDFAASLSLQWNQTLAYYAEKDGYEVDATQDLARVLRMPGSYNHKPEHPAPVLCQVITTDGPRYDIDELMAYFKAPAKKAKPAKAPKVVTTRGALTLDENAAPNADRLDELMKARGFVKTWDKDRKFKKDNSASAYEMALASFAINAGWDDQETCNLLIMWRRKHQLMPILKNGEAYFLRTINQAHSDNDGDYFTPEDDDDDTTRREKIITALHTMFKGVTIVRIVKYAIQKPIYRLITDRGEIVLGDVGNLIDQTRFRNHMASAAGVYIPLFNKQRWEVIGGWLLDLCEVEEIEEATTTGQFKMLIREYLDDNTPTDDINPAVIEKAPYTKDGAIYIQIAGFAAWLAVSARSEPSDRATLGINLKIIGAAPDVQAVRFENGKKSTRSVWKLPAWVVTDEDEGN